MTTTLPCRNLLLGVSGSIHCTQLSQYLVRLRDEFAEHVRVIMTSTAASMLPPPTVELLTDAPILTDLWGQPGRRSPHISETRWADAFLVLPATANLLGKAANGIADDLLTTALLAYPGPVIFAPSMNPTMWRSPALQRNVRTLTEDGHHVLAMTEITAIGTGDLHSGLGPTPDTLMPQLWEAFLRTVANDYRAEATHEPPRTTAIAVSSA